MFAAFDLDGTLIRNNSSYAFCKFLVQQHFLTKKEFFYSSTLYFRHLFLGLSLWDVHHHVFDRLFKGRSTIELELLASRFSKTQPWYSPALKRLENFKKNDVEVAVFSSSPYFLVKSIISPLDISRIFATDYEMDRKGILLNIKTLMDGQKKAYFLKKMAKGRKTHAFSDSLTDLAFLEAAEQATAVRAGYFLKKIAKKKNWELI